MNGFTLHLQSPMMSFGDTGFGQLRDAGTFPGRSVVLGIVAAACGIRRNDERLLELHQRCRVHIAAVQPGSPSVDYHIVRPFTEYEAQSLHLQRRPAVDVSSVITYREYLHDAHFIAIVEVDNKADAEFYQAQLHNPVFVSYLGRRSCPPATPLIPGEIKEPSIGAAFLAAAEEWEQYNSGQRRKHSDSMSIWLDSNDVPDGMPLLTRSVRRDLLVALPRSYVNRTVVHTRIALPSQQTALSTNQEYFDAAP